MRLILAKHPPVLAFKSIMFLIFLILAGCSTSSRTIPLGGTVARSGIDVSQAALDGLDRIEGLSSVAAERDLFGKVIVVPDKSGIIPTPVYLYNFGDDIRFRRIAYTNLRNMYKSFNALSDPSFSSNTETATTDLVNAANSFAKAASLPLLGANVSSTVPRLAAKLVSEIQAGKIKTLNARLAALSSVAKENWDEDQIVINSFIDKIFTGLPNTIAGLPDDAFDKKSLSSTADKPYSAPIMLRIFKVNQYEMARLKVKEEKENLEKVSLAFDVLERAHLELEKDNPSVNDVLEDANEVAGLLSN